MKERRKWRWKLILEDGRKVYASKRGEIDLMTDSERFLAEMTGLSSRAMPCYTPDLSLFGDLLGLGLKRKDVIAVVRFEFEPVDAPLDLDAFTQAGPVTAETRTRARL